MHIISFERINKLQHLNDVILTSQNNKSDQFPKCIGSIIYIKYLYATETYYQNTIHEDSDLFRDDHFNGSYCILDHGKLCS
jgi:hypothetical protein